MTREQYRAAGWGLFWSGLLAVAIFVGSRNLRNVDAALVGYTFACLFAAFAIAYRYSMWLHRPPTRMYWRRGWQAFLTPGHLWANARHLAGRFVRLFALNEHILTRSRSRGFAHLLIMWGCVLAAAITFPLVFGWVHFETVPDGRPACHHTPPAGRNVSPYLTDRIFPRSLAMARASKRLGSLLHNAGAGVRSAFGPRPPGGSALTGRKPSPA